MSSASALPSSSRKPAASSFLQVGAGALGFALSVGAALLASSHDDARSAQPDFASQLRGLRGVSTLELDRAAQPARGDATLLANQAAEQNQARQLSQFHSSRETQLIGTAHHQVRGSI